MSNPYNTDGILLFPEQKKPHINNAFESIECAIAFDVRDWSESRRTAWIYQIVFGPTDFDDSWNRDAKMYGWDDDDRKRAKKLHEQWIKAKEFLKNLE